MSAKVPLLPPGCKRPDVAREPVHGTANESNTDATTLADASQGKTEVSTKPLVSSRSASTEQLANPVPSERRELSSSPHRFGNVERPVPKQRTKLPNSYSTPDGFRKSEEDGKKPPVAYRAPPESSSQPKSDTVKPPVSPKSQTLHRATTDYSIKPDTPPRPSVPPRRNATLKCSSPRRPDPPRRPKRPDEPPMTSNAGIKPGAGVSEVVKAGRRDANHHGVSNGLGVRGNKLIPDGAPHLPETSGQNSKLAHRRQPKQSDKETSGNHRPISMIVNSQQLDTSQHLASSLTIPRDKKATMLMSSAKSTPPVNKHKKGLFRKLKKYLHHNESVQSSSSSDEEETNDASEDLSDKGATIKSRPQLRHVTTLEREKKRSSMIDAEDPSHEHRHLFECVIVVGLRTVTTTSALSPVVTYRFPPALSDSKDPAMEEIPNFCFPDIDTIKPVTDFKSETFSFVLTDINGDKRFGYSRRLLPSGSGPRLPEVYCIISSLGCFSMYKKILDNLEERRKVSPSAVFTLLKSIMANPFPAPGKSIEVNVFSAKGDGMQVIKFTRPLDSRLEHVDFSSLFSCLDIKQVVQLFSAMLMERRIIFCAEKMSTFSSCCHAAASLLYPCDWQHIFIPVLPNKLIDFCCSPLPYILGILPQNLPLLDDMDMEEAFIIHLDEGKVLNKIGDESMILPAKAKGFLEQSLVTYLEQWEQQNILDSGGISEIFVTFFAYLLGHYPDFMEIKNPSTNEKAFKTEKYIKSFTSDADKRFLDAFQNTQMFDVFVQQREDPSMYSTIANGYFERNISKLREKSKAIDTISTKYSLAAKWKKFAKRFRS